MAAIATVMLAFLRPGDTILHSRPLYGGTETLIRNQLTRLRHHAGGLHRRLRSRPDHGRRREAMAQGRVGLIMLESPANPTNGLVDLEAVAAPPPRSRSARATGRRSPSTTRCSGRCTSGRCEHGADLSHLLA